jgi:hypothetical protein
VNVENVTRVGFAPWGPAQQKRHLSVSDGLFGQVIVNAKRVAPRVPEEFTHRDTRVRRQVLQGCSLYGGSNDDRRKVHGSMGLELVDDLSHRGRLLSDGDVKAKYAFTFLIDYRVNRDCRLACLTVADDKLALAATDRYHGVDCLDSGLYCLLDGLSGDDAGCLDLDIAALFG